MVRGSIIEGSGGSRFGNFRFVPSLLVKVEFFLSLIIPPKTRFLGTRLDGDDLYPLLSQIDRNKNFQTIFKMSWVKEKCIIIV